MVKENLTKVDPYRVERMTGFNEGKILVDGNTAAALGALFGGVTVTAWYPITPSSSLAETISQYGPKLRTDPDTGKATYAVIQAEDELAAAGMVIGAGWAGARAMTATSGPGISLMSEFARPGLLRRNSLGDLGHSAHGAEHRSAHPHWSGRYSVGVLRQPRRHAHVVLLPSTPTECFEFANTAFDLAEQLQTLVFVLSDLDLGMNMHICDQFEYPEQPLNRGKVLTAEQLNELGGS
ncbi:MAG: hypothetical protein R2856_05015 [Caldilineaceae bacterium]